MVKYLLVSAIIYGIYRFMIKPTSSIEEPSQPSAKEEYTDYEELD